MRFGAIDLAHQESEGDIGCQVISYRVIYLDAEGSVFVEHAQGFEAREARGPGAVGLAGIEVPFRPWIKNRQFEPVDVVQLGLAGPHHPKHDRAGRVVIELQYRCSHRPSILIRA